MTEMTPEAWNRLILDAYRQGLADAAKQTPTIGPISSAEMAALDSHVGQLSTERPSRWEASTAFRDRMAGDVVKTFWACLPMNQIKWSALSRPAKDEITDTITNAVKVHLLAHFGGLS